jgi:hypothetical protein
MTPDLIREATLACSAGALRIGVALLLLSAAWSKLREPARFAGILRNYRLLPDLLTTPLSLLLPMIELMLGAALLLERGGRISSPAAAMLLLVFAGAIAINLGRGRTTIDCGCSLAGGQPIHAALVWRNSLTALALLATTAVQGPTPLPLMALAACTGVALFLLYLLFNQIVALTGRVTSAR